MLESTKQMLAKLETAALECLWIGNEDLPEDYHDDREGGRSLARINKMFEDKAGLTKTDHQIEKEAKAIRCEAYRHQLETSESFDYIEDEHKLYAAQLVFCGAMVKAGVMEEEEE